MATNGRPDGGRRQPPRRPLPARGPCLIPQAGKVAEAGSSTRRNGGRCVCRQGCGSRERGGSAGGVGAALARTDGRGCTSGSGPGRGGGVAGGKDRVPGRERDGRSGMVVAGVPDGPSAGGGEGFGRGCRPPRRLAPPRAAGTCWKGTYLGATALPLRVVLSLASTAGKSARSPPSWPARGTAGKGEETAPLHLKTARDWPPPTAETGPRPATRAKTAPRYGPITGSRPPLAARRARRQAASGGVPCPSGGGATFPVLPPFRPLSCCLKATAGTFAESPLLPSAAGLL
jgi:hypothetical protein